MSSQSMTVIFPKFILIAYNANDMMKIFAATKEFDTVRSEILKKRKKLFKFKNIQTL